MKQLAAGWKEKADFIHKLLTLLNSYQPPDVRNATFGKYSLVVLMFHKLFKLLQFVYSMLNFIMFMYTFLW